MFWPKEKPFNRYLSDRTDAEWERVHPLLEEPEKIREDALGKRIFAI